MELKINQFQAPDPIQFNFVELKRWVQDGAEKYKVTVYTDDNIAQAKADRADLNRLKKALNDRRIQIEKEYMKPFTEFKDKINEIIKLIDEPAKLIDQRVKEYEEAKKNEKAEQITEWFSGIEGRPDWLEIGQIWDQKWLNASKSMKSIKEEIEAALAQIHADLETLAGITEFGFEATEEYKRTLDINRALAEGMRLSDIQKRKEAEAARKAEEEARRAEEERQAKLDSILNNPATQIINREEAAVQPEPYWEPQEPAQVVHDARQMEFETSAEHTMPVSFRAWLTRTQALELKKFFMDRGICFEQLKY